ncbi:MAG: hypothetical protein ACKPKO_13230, partial [Candidatus Fonsibacter sp.]
MYNTTWVLIMKTVLTTSSFVFHVDSVPLRPLFVTVITHPAYVRQEVMTQVLVLLMALVMDDGDDDDCDDDTEGDDTGAGAGDDDDDDDPAAVDNLPGDKKNLFVLKDGWFLTFPLSPPL